MPKAAGALYPTTPTACRQLLWLLSKSPTNATMFCQKWYKFGQAAGNKEGILARMANVARTANVAKTANFARVSNVARMANVARVAKRQ